MAILPIVIGESQPVLRKKTTKIPRVTKEIDQLIDDMMATCINADGLGLAAPQVDVGVRLCVAKLHGKLTPMVNPHITWKGKEAATAEEGCLSLPGQYVDVTRAKEIIVRYTDRKGNEQERKLSNLDARVVQHEVDHLDGVLIVDFLLSGNAPRHDGAAIA